MKKLFISQPMRGKSNTEILEARRVAAEAAEKLLGEPVEVMKTFFGTSDLTHALEYLGESIKMLAQADAVYFVDGWQDARGCRIEHECAVQYGIAIVGE